jgi:hypothetical protein
LLELRFRSVILTPSFRQPFAHPVALEFIRPERRMDC